MLSLYTIFSESIGQYYCGQKNNLNDRLYRHNAGETQSIKHGIPWKLIGYVNVATRSEEVRLENTIKKRGIKRWLEKNEHKLTMAG